MHEKSEILIKSGKVTPISVVNSTNSEDPSSRCLQIQPNQFPGDIQGILKKIPEDFLCDRPHNIKMQVK